MHKLFNKYNIITSKITKRAYTRTHVYIRIKTSQEQSEDKRSRDGLKFLITALMSVI